MKKLKQIKGWGIYKNNKNEIREYGFLITIISPRKMDCGYKLTTSCADMEFDTVEDAERWINNYKAE